MQGGTGALTRMGEWVTRVTSTSYTTNVYGLARTLLACGTLLTLLTNSTASLFIPAAGLGPAPSCIGFTNASLYCLLPTLESARWVSITILLVVAIGVFPRWTAIPHWWVAFSLQSSATTLDGGDQVSAVLALLLVPLALCDGRRTHWSSAREVGEPSERIRAARFVSYLTVVLIRVQASVLYFHAGVSKLAVVEWADGTAMYYWLNDASFGSPPWYRWAFDPLLANGNLLALFTWSMMIGEIVLDLALALIAPQRHWRYYLAGAVAFHAGIALVIGLVSFACAMIALDVLFLHAANQPMPRLRLAFDRLTARVPRPRTASPAVRLRARQP